MIEGEDGNEFWVRGPRGPRGRRGPRGFDGPFGSGRAQRGDTRDAVLLRLLDGPKHGYQLMSEIDELSGGVWKPGPGSVYPVVKALAEAGLVKVDRNGERRTIELTEDGRTIAERRLAAGAPPWERIAAEGANAPTSLPGAIKGLMPALHQLAHHGSAASQQRIADKLGALRSEIYAELAEDDTTDAATTEPAGD